MNKSNGSYSNMNIGKEDHLNMDNKKDTSDTIKPR